MSSDRYEIRGKIGQGGVGAVYRAYDTQLRREVAMKRVLQDGELNTEDATANLLKEATALSSVQHPHIVTVYDAGIDAEGPYVVMELINGKTLDEMVERGTLTFEDFKEVALQSQEAMIAAQDLDLVHRDLKPSNVMVSWLPSGRFQVKIVDFGLAKFSAKPSLQTIDHGDAVFGSIFFMAPEQFERTPLDRRTDMYSLGAMYYYALSGEYPFNGDTAPQVMAAHLQNKVTPLLEVRPDLPPWVCDWVMWHIRRDTDDRPESARAALEHFLAHDSVHTFGVTASQPLQAAAPGTEAQQPTGASSPQPVVSPTGQLNPHTAAQQTAAQAVASGTLTAHIPTAPATTPAPMVTAVATPATTQTQQPQETAAPVAPIVPQKAKLNPIIIIIAIVLLGLIIMLSIMLMTSNDETSTKKIINGYSAQVKPDNPQHTVPVKKSHLETLLNGFIQHEPEISKNCKFILMQAKAAEDNYDPDLLIATFATDNAVMDETRRQSIFKDIIKVRAEIAGARTSAFSVLTKWASTNTNHESVVAALESIRNRANSADDFSPLTKAAITADNGNFLTAVESTLKAIVERSKIKNDLAKQLTTAYDSAKNTKNKQTFVNVASLTGSESALRLIRSGLTSEDAPTLNQTFIALNNWPNKTAVEVTTDIVNQTPDDGKLGTSLRKNGIGAISRMLYNSHTNKINVTSSDWDKLISLAKSDTEYSEILKVLANIPEAWVPPVLNKVQAKVKSPQIQKAVDQSIKRIQAELK